MANDTAFYVARNRDTARKHGKRVLAARISNHDFQHRFAEFGGKRRMKDLPGNLEHICLGYMVVRKLGTPEEFVTWMPTDVFARHYRPVHGFELARSQYKG